MAKARRIAECQAAFARLIAGWPAGQYHSPGVKRLSREQLRQQLMAERGLNEYDALKLIPRGDGQFRPPRRRS